jgi:predicted phosphodiesterase
VPAGQGVPRIGLDVTRFSWLGPPLAAGWLALAAAPAGAATLTRGPYLQLVTESSALVVWRTSAAVACTLVVAPPGGATFPVATPPSTQHVASLAGLTAGTRYDYSIRSAGTLASGLDCFVETAPAPGTGSTTRLLVWGDSGTGSASQLAVATVLNQQDADLGLHVGDIIYPSGEAAYYDPRYFQPYAPLLRHTPVWAVPGNHDVPNLQAFYDAWYLPTNPVNGTERYYSFDYGDVHCVALDTNLSFTTAVLDWIAADLDASTRRWKIVFFHHTMYSCGNYHGSSTTLINTLGPVFDAHDVDLVFYGHDHHYERSWPMYADQPVATAMDPDYVDPAGTIYVVSGAAASPRSVGMSCDHTAAAFSTLSFTRVEVTGDELVLEAVDTSAQVFDRMTLRKTGAPPPPPPPPPADSVRVLAPAAGATVLVGAPLEVRWSASAGIAALRIELSRAGAAGPWETLAASTPNDGVEAWTASEPASADCWVRVSDAADGNPSDTGDGAFAIARPDSGGGEPPPGQVRVNFQPATAAVPAGYVADTGLPFDVVRGYGWAATMFLRERGMLPGDPRDTFVDVTNTATGTWELAVPDGLYHVSLTCGDPYTSATHRVALEGAIVVQDVYTIGGQFVERTDLPVVVSDGRLTMAVGGNGQITHSKVNAIVVVPAAGYVLLEPDAGATLCLGESLVVQWSGGSGTDSVAVELSRAGAAGPWETLLAATPDDGDATCALPGPPAPDCRLRLRAPGGAVLVQSAAGFALVEPSILLVRPNGGETWMTGTVQRFEWTSECLAADVAIEVSRDGSEGPWTTLLGPTANDGEETWTVRKEDVGWTHARVVAVPVGTPHDRSDAPFTVVDLPPPPPGVWRYDFAPAGTSPATGYEIDAGEAYTTGRGYGWNAAQWMKQRNMLPGDCRDTFVQVVNNTTSTWNLDLTNGAYRVSLVCGDPYTSGTHRVALEGEVVVQDVYAVGGVYVTRDDLPVTVLDGQLTVALGGNGQITSTKLDCIEVESATPPPGSGRGRRVKHEIREDGAAAAAAPSTGLEVPSGVLRDAAEVRLWLARAAHVRVDVHDVRGRRVALLHDGALAAGLHAFHWRITATNGGPLPPGVYFVRLAGSGLADRRKVVVVK